MMKVLMVVIVFVAMTNAQGYKRVCYYSNWSQYRAGIGKFFPRDIPADLCTHLIYSFAQLNSDYTLIKYEWNDEELYKEFNSLKDNNPMLKTLLAVGGWTAASAGFTAMVSDEALRKKFATTSVKFLRRRKFDGLDMDWEYPALRGGKPSDKENFVKLLKDLSEAFHADAVSSGSPRLLLTAAVAAGKRNIDTAYDIPGMNKYLDFINLMSYDLHGGWEKYLGHNSPLFARPDEQGAEAMLNVNWAANNWVEKGTPKENLIIGLATYGRGFELKRSNKYKMGDPAVGAGEIGPYTKEKGYMAYYEICPKIDAAKDPTVNSDWKLYYEEESMVPYMVNTKNMQWIGYEDVYSISTKLYWIREKGFGGAMVWNIDLDDFRKECASSSRPYPLMSLMGDILGGGYIPPPTNPPPPVTYPTDPPIKSTTNKPIIPPIEVFTCTGKPNDFYADPVNCNKFYQCLSGKTYHSACASSLYWNQAVKTCDFPRNVNCVLNQQPTPSVNLPTNPPTILPTEIPTDSPTDFEDVYSFCLDKMNGLYSNPSNYHRYFRCHDNKTFCMTCGLLLRFNPENGKCELP